MGEIVDLWNQAMKQNFAEFATDDAATTGYTISWAVIN